MCTNTSLPPSCGAMKPKPLPWLNHLTVPIAIAVALVGGVAGGTLWRNRSKVTTEDRTAQAAGRSLEPVAGAFASWGEAGGGFLAANASFRLASYRDRAKCRDAGARPAFPSCRGGLG